MRVVADSSPLITLAKVGCFHLLPRLYSRVIISPEIHHEVVVAGAGLAGALEVSQCDWIELQPLDNPADLRAIHARLGLGLGELSAILLASQIRADLVLLDDFKGRRLAIERGLGVRGSVGILERLYRKGLLPDLRAAFQQLLAHRAYVDTRLLNSRLHALRLPPLR